MRSKKPYIISILLFLVMFLLSGCGDNAAESMYQHLEKAVAQEEVFKEQQEPLLDAEKKEHELYEQIISLGTDESDEILTLSKEATTFLDKRKELIDGEKKSIDLGYEEFNKIESVVKQLKEESLKTAAGKMIEAMDKRYSSYQELYQEYSNALELDRELYEMLQQEEVTMDSLQVHIDKINESYENVMTAKDEFNQHTEEYNKLKKTFYSKTNLKITY